MWDWVGLPITYARGRDTDDASTVPRIASCSILSSVRPPLAVEPRAKLEQGLGRALIEIAVDIPMGRVKFNVNTEYAYIQNFKILQSTRHPQKIQDPYCRSNHHCADCFAKHGIDRTVPVESLVKCKMQDNLEFLQWSKRFWDQYFPGHEYDAVARRKGTGAPATSTAAAPAPRTSMGASTTRKPGTTPVSRPAPRAAGASGASSALKAENDQLKEAIGGLEKERDFYFSKLRDIELLLQTAIEQDPSIENDENGLIKNIQTILYSTEEGFEIPDLEANGAEEPETF